MTRSTSSKKQFGRFDVDLDSRELRRQGVRVRLQDQSFQLLVALLERPGQVVTRINLRERLWPAQTSGDFDHGLNTAVAKLRQALGDSAESPRFIETLPKHGYRFVAPVTDSADSVGVSGASAMDTRSPRRADAIRVVWARFQQSCRPWPRWPAIAVAVATVVTVFAFTRMFPAANWLRTARTTPSADLAVLPLHVVGLEGSDPTVGIRIADAVITQLANVRSLRLRPTAAILGYENTSDPVGAAHELDVAHVLYGTLHKQPEGFRARIQLIRRADGMAIWGKTYDVRGKGSGRLNVEDAVARQVARELAVLPPPGGLEQQSTWNVDSRELYSQGKALLVNYSEANIRAAVEAFEHALRIEPRDTLVRAELSIALAWFSRRYTHELEAADWGRRADGEASIALEQDPALPEAHLARAYAASTPYGGVNWPLVLEEAETALALDPRLSRAHAARAEAFYHFGLFDLVETELHAAFGIDSPSSIETERLELAAALFSGRFADVSHAAEKLRRRTDAPVVPTYLGTALFYLGERDRAEDLLSSTWRGAGDVRSQAALGGVLAANGKRTEAREIVERTASSPHIDHHVSYSLGATLAQLGQPQEAVQWLRRAADEGFPCYPWFRDDPLLTPIRQNAAFLALLDDLRMRFEKTRLRYSRSLS